MERSLSQRVVEGVPDTAILGHSSRLSRYDVTSSLIRYRTHSTDAHGHILEWGARAQLPLESCASIDGTRLAHAQVLVASDSRDSRPY